MSSFHTISWSFQQHISNNHLYISSSKITWHQPFHCYLEMAVWNVLHQHCGSYLCTLSASNNSIPCMWTFSPVAPPPPVLSFWFLQGMFIINSFLCSFFNNNCYVVPPMHLQFMCHPSMCTDKWLPRASTLCPSVFPANKAHKDHPQRISYILVAVLNPTLLTFRCQAGWRRKKKKKGRKKKNNSFKFRLFQVDHLRTATVDWGSLFTFCKLL